MIDGAVEAPGEAPRRPAIEPSAALMTSVPNFSSPPTITWARWPAFRSVQSSSFAVGMKARRLCTLPLWVFASSVTRYLTRSRLVNATLSMLNRFEKRTWVMRSHQWPRLRNFGVKVANGPNSSEVSPSTTRVSRCGTDIGGAPTAACEYTFALCCATRVGFEVISHCPPIGNTP